MNDLKSGLRQLLKAPAFSLVAILTLGLGIGACTVVFSWIQGILIDAIPSARSPERLVVLAERNASGSIDDTLSYLDIQDLASETGVFAGILATQSEAVTLRVERDVEWVWTQTTTANFFDVLGVQPILGRTFRPEEDRSPGGNPVAVISYSLWQRRFGGRPEALGQSVDIARRPFTVIGVAPPEFRGTMGGLKFDLWIPVSMATEHPDIARAFQSRGWRWLHVVARLADGTSRANAQVVTDAVMRRLEMAYPKSNRNVGTAVLPLWRCPWGAQGRMLPLLAALAGVAALLLLLVVANVANLLLARASARDSEMAVRLALGAGRARLIRLVLVECLVLSSLGALVGLGVASLASHALTGLLPPTPLPVALAFPIDLRILAFTTTVALGAGLMAGWFPAWRATRAHLADTLKAGGRDGASSRAGQRLRQVLVVTEIAAALVLLVGMTLCYRSFERARQLDVGLDPRGVWVAGFRLPPGAYAISEAMAFYRRLKEEVARLPGVTDAALTDWLPLGFEGGSSTGFSVPGYQPSPGESVDAGVGLVSAGFHSTLRIPLLKGREFDARDGPEAPKVVIINQRLAERYFAGRDPVGRTLDLWGEPRTIVGVTSTGKYRFLNESPRSYLYLPVEQISDHALTVVLRTTTSPRALAQAVEQTARRLDPNAKPMAAMPLTDYMGAAYLIPRTAAILLAVLGAAAVLLGGLGIYGVIAWSVSRRTREIGVRVALGAPRAGVAWIFIRQGLRLAAIGSFLGFGASVLGARCIGNLLVDTSYADPLTYLIAIPALVLVVTLACWLPARRAARIEPIVALRAD